MTAEEKLATMKAVWNTAHYELEISNVDPLIATIEAILELHPLVHIRDGLFGCSVDGLDCETRAVIDETLELE